MSSLETWPQDLTDFALVSKDGKILRCHKARLFENSEYFRAMLSHKMRETSNNQMDVPEYDGVTVACFLEWIYADKIGGKVMKMLRESAQPGKFICQRQFDEAKFTPALLKMAHLYQLKDLQANCEEYLERNVTKENALEAWAAAGDLGSQKLRDKSLGAIAQSYKKGKASEFPGLADNAISLEEMMEWIVDHTTIKGEAGSDQFHVKVAREGYGTIVVNATPDEKVSSFKARVAPRFGLHNPPIGFNGRYPAMNETTLRQWGVKSGDTLTMY